MLLHAFAGKLMFYTLYVIFQCVCSVYIFYLYVISEYTCPVVSIFKIETKHKVKETLEELATVTTK